MLDDVASRLDRVPEAALIDDVATLGPMMLGSALDGSPLVQTNPPSGGLGLADAALDGAGVTASMAAAAVFEAMLHGGGGKPAAALAAFSRLLLCLPVLVIVLGPSRERLRTRLHTTVAQQLREVAAPIAGATLACIAAWRVARGALGGARPPEDALLVTCVVGIALVAALRAGELVWGRHDGGGVRRVLFVGSGLVAERVGAHLEATSRVGIVGFVDDDPLDADGQLGTLSDLEEVCRRHDVDHVVVAFSHAPAERIVEALRPVQGRLPISVVPRLFDVLPATAGAHDLASGYPAMSVPPAAFGWWPRAVKRGADVVGASLALVLVLPVLAVAVIGVRLSSPGPVVLRQARIGKNGQPFTVWKFRTFTVTESVPPEGVLAGGENVTGPFPKLKEDPRATRFGRLLRRTSVDELPQLLNVIGGSMSLVGPRPLQPEYAWSFGPWAMQQRYAVKPGLTGLWQVSGRNDLTYEEMCRLDQLYATCWSVGLDVRILVRTIRAVLGGRGCY